MSTEKKSLDLSNIAERASVLSGLGWDIEKLKGAHIMVIGAGALGNEVLKNLALIGVGNVLIIDFDTIEHTNLARSVLYREKDCTGDTLKVDIAAERIKDINPSLKTMTINGDITLDVGLGVFRRMDVIIGCVDNRLARLNINRFCHALSKTWVDGGIVDLGGQVTVFEPGISCYECQLSPEAWANIRFRMGCLDRAMRYASSGLANTIPITSSVVGAMQVQEALKYVGKSDKVSTLAGKQFFYEGMSNYYDTLPASRLKDICTSHVRIKDIIEAEDLSQSNSVKETFDWLIKYFQDNEIVINLNFDLVVEIATERSEKIIELIKPRQRITKEELQSYRELEGEDVRITKNLKELNKDFHKPNLALKEIGIAPLQILSVISKGKKYYVELSGDKNFLSFS